MGTVLEFVTDDSSDMIAEISIVSLAGGAMGGLIGPAARDTLGIVGTLDFELETIWSDMMQGAIIGAASGTVAQGVVTLPLLP